MPRHDAGWPTLPAASDRAAGGDGPHMPQLDALRAFAVLGVLASHFCRDTPAFAPAGHLGVRLFFVLSGFLITGILLRCRALVDAGQPLGLTMRRFYARRFLRIAPLYYAVLLLAWIAGIPYMREAAGWHAAYLSNVYFTRIGAWQGPLSHFWSLAVEEQFYLVWPAVILLVPQRSLIRAVVLVTAIGPLYRAVGELVGLSQMALWTMPFTALDALGFGALLGVLADPSRASGGARRAPGLAAPAAAEVGRSLVVPRWLAGAAAVSAALLAWYLAAWVERPAKLVWLMDRGLGELAWTVIFGALVLGAARGFGGAVGRCLRWPPLAYLGRISYGVYLIHLFVPMFLPRALAAVGLAYPASEGYRFVYLTAATIALASLSWALYERPLNRLKRWVPYGGPAALRPAGWRARVRGAPPGHAA